MPVNHEGRWYQNRMWLRTEAFRLRHLAPRESTPFSMKCANNPEKMGTNLRANYGQFYIWLADEPHRDMEGPRAVLRDHILSNLPFAAGQEILGIKLHKRRLHSVQSASREFAMHPQRLRKLLAAGGIIPTASVRNSKPHHCVIFDADTAATFIEKIKISYSIKQIYKYLNIDRSQAGILIRSGFIKPSVDVRFVSNQGCDYCFIAEDLDRFLDTLLDNAEVIEDPTTDQISIAKASKRTNRSATEIIPLIQGGLIWVGRNIQSSGYASVLVSLREVKQHLHGGASLKGLTQRDICDRYGIADRAVAALMETGILSTVVEKHPIHMGPVTVVPEEAATDFFARFATLFQIARETGQHHVKLNRLLRHRQCKPAFDPTKLGLTIYNREEVSLALGPS